MKKEETYLIIWMEYFSGCKMENVGTSYNLFPIHAYAVTLLHSTQLCIEAFGLGSLCLFLFEILLVFLRSIFWENHQ